MSWLYVIIDKLCCRLVRHLDRNAVCALEQTVSVPLKQRRVDCSLMEYVGSLSSVGLEGGYFTRSKR